jgi:eukaryotic-like serine/threonine-protein kinase
LNDQLPMVHITLGRIHNNTNKTDLALQEFLRALDLDPRSPDAIAGTAAVYENQRRYKEAEETFRRATVLRPDYWDGYNNLGLFYYRRRRFAEAAVQLRKVVELTPDNSAGYVNLGVVLAADGKLPEAAGAYQQAIRIAPSYGIYNGLGNIHYRQKNYAEMAKSYEASIKLNDKDYRLWLNLALANRLLDRTDQVKAANERALPLLEETAKVRPQDATVQSALGLLYANLGKPEQAIPRMEAALALAPEDASVMERVGEAYEALGDRRKAIDLVTNSLKAGYSFESLKQSPGVRALLTDPNFKSPPPAKK